MSKARSERFWSKVDRSAGPEACWPFTGAINDAGYGVFRTNRRHVRAHRYAYLIETGELPAGDLDHLCHNGSGCHRVDECPHRRCVNPRHLEDVSHAENVRRGNAPGVAGINHTKTHCPRGHAYDDQNTYRTPAGHRRCRACNRDRGVALKGSAA